ncbi:MAG: hypothetical protein AAGA19_03910 [Pseudomonadota bacterium]
MGKSPDNIDNSDATDGGEAQAERQDQETIDGILAEETPEDGETSDHHGADTPEEPGFEGDGEHRDEDVVEAYTDISEDELAAETSESSADADADPDGAEVSAEETAEDEDEAEQLSADPAEEEDGGDTTDETSETSSKDLLAAALATSPLVSDGKPEPAHDPVEGVADEPDPEPAAEEHEEEHHRSFASRVLTWLILLLAGGGLALWGAPRIAPELPDGLGPVKAWLMPGEFESRRRIAALESSVETRLSDLAPGLDEAGVREVVATQVAAMQDATSTQIQELSDQVAAADSASIEGRLAQLETRIEGMAAELSTLQGLTPDGGTGPDLSVFTGTVDGLRAELAALAEQQGGLSQRIDDVEVEVARRLTEAEAEVAAATDEAANTKSSALAEAAVSMIAAAIASGEPFDTAVVQLAENTEAEVPSALVEAAAGGVATLGVLRNSFSDAAHAAIRADITSSGSENVGSRLTSFLEAQIATRSLTPQEGDSADAVLSRAEDALRRDNLDAAVTELERLPDAARAAMDAWISRAVTRVSAAAGLAEVRAALN